MCRYSCGTFTSPLEIVFQKCRDILMNRRSNTPSFPRSPQFHDEKKKSLIKTREKTVRGFRDLFVKKKKARLLSEAKWSLLGPLHARDDKWISGLDRIHSKPIRPTRLSPFPWASPNLIDGEARSCVENSHRAARAFGFSRDIRRYVSRRYIRKAWRLRRERTTGRRENASSVTSFFFAPSYLAYAESGRTIYFRCVKTSDWWRHDANFTMWELIVTGSHRRE